MIISGIACTPAAALQGHVLLSRAIDTARRVPLYVEHKYQVGEVTSLMYVGPDLYCACELDDEAASQLGYFSVAGRPVHREQHDTLWHVSKFHLHEISLVRVPQNDRCKVLDRRPSSPFRALHQTRIRQLDLFQKAFENLSLGLKEVARHAG